MTVLVFVESAEGKIKKTSLEAVAYAAALGGEVVALAMGNETDATELEALGKYGANKVLQIADERLNQGVIQAYSNAIAQVMTAVNAEILVLANSSLGNPVSARVAIKQEASLVSNVTELPDTSNGFRVKRSIYTGKAFANVELTKAKKIIAIKKNAAEIKEIGQPVSVESFEAQLNDDEKEKKITTR